MQINSCPIHNTIIIRTSSMAITLNNSKIFTVHVMFYNNGLVFIVEKIYNLFKYLVRKTHIGQTKKKSGNSNIPLGKEVKAAQVFKYNKPQSQIENIHSYFAYI